MVEVLFLLLPIAALSGWWMARKQYRGTKNKSTNRLASNYITGLNYLLNEQPDKAIYLFIHMLEVDS